MMLYSTLKCTDGTFPIYHSIIPRIHYLFFISLALMFSAGCKKKVPPMVMSPAENKALTPGLPSNPKQINGFFYARYSLDRVQNPSGPNKLSALAVFNDPAIDLFTKFNHSQNVIFSNIAGNISVGEVVFSGIPLSQTNQNAKLRYLTQTFNNSDVPAGSGNSLTSNWSIEGNKTFKGFDMSLSDLLPMPLNPTLSYTLSLAGDTIPLVNNNYDSLKVEIGTLIIKKIPKGANHIIFTAEDYKGLPPGNYGISFTAYNYAHCIIDDKIYLFENGTKLNQVFYLTSN